MQRFIAVRLFQAVIALLILSVLVFALARASGDPTYVMLPPDAPQGDIAQLRSAWGLDRPYYVQYGLFISHAVKGDFGKSLRARRPVVDLIKERLPNSVSLAGVSMAFAVLLAFPLGVVAAVKKGTVIDTLAKVLAILGQSMPMFWLGIVLMDVISVRLKLLPTSGIGGPTHYILPAFTLGWFVVAGMMRLLRSSMVDVLQSDYVQWARSKGVPEWKIIWKHAFRNALIPVVTFGGVYLALLITAAVVVETVFAWPGIGLLAYNAIMTRDFPVIQGVILTCAVLVMAVNLLVDILYARIDPRIRYG